MQSAADRRLSQPVELYPRNLSDAGGCRDRRHPAHQTRLLRRHAQSQSRRDHPGRPRTGFLRPARPRPIAQRCPNGVMEAYKYPQYYAITLAPSNPARELDFFEAAIEKFSKVKVNRVFELGAGTAPYLEEWHKRGYAYCGLDLSREMIEYAREKAHRLRIAGEFILGDMRDLDRGLGPFDLAYVLLGSLYVRSNREFLDHLDRVADVLSPRGLYLLDSFVWFRIFHDYRRSWTRQKNGVRVHTRYRAEIVDPVAQTYNECLTFTVDDHGKDMTIAGRVPAKVFFPQEFLCLVETSGRFEFVGWFNDFSFTAEVRPEGRHLVILRNR